MEFKKYNHLTEEIKISNYWIKKGCFKPKKGISKKTFSIVIPPPNITGRLHMGHALNNSLQDVLVRFNRMKGYERIIRNYGPEADTLPEFQAFEIKRSGKNISATKKSDLLIKKN